jgi:SAM-dependent methyltransferase
MKFCSSVKKNTAQKKSSFANFFKGVQDAPWYRLFLTPAVVELQVIPPGSKALDVGTGPGKFIELAKEQLSLIWAGVDTDEAMLYHARQRPALADVMLSRVEPDRPLPFASQEFDVVCFCSVLFTLADPYPLLKESLRLLRPGGKIIVLTPSGRVDFRKEVALLIHYDFSIDNWTFFLWRILTGSRARKWAKKNLLTAVAEKNDLIYSRHFSFKGFAMVETLEK